MGIPNTHTMPFKIPLALFHKNLTLLSRPPYSRNIVKEIEVKTN